MRPALYCDRCGGLGYQTDAITICLGCGQLLDVVDDDPVPVECVVPVLEEPAPAAVWKKR